MPIDEHFRRPDDPVDPWDGHPAWPQVRRAIAMLHLGSLLYLLLTAGAYAADFGGLATSLTALLPWPLQYVVLAYLTLGCVIALVADVVVVRGLRQRRPWAWIAALVLFALDASSIVFLPMTIIGVKALGDPEVRAAFD